MKNGLLDIINSVARKKGLVTFQFLTGKCLDFKALPANRKRWKKGEEPKDTEIRYLGTYDDAMELLSGNESKDIAFIVWIDRAEFEKVRAAKEDTK